MSTHLTDEQLSARHDDALAPRARARVDAHLAACEACRARLAELARLDASLAEALVNEPGEAYFAGLADRVTARVAAERAAGAAPKSRGRGWFTPRVLAWSASVAVIALVSVLAVRSRAPRPVVIEQQPFTSASEPMALSPDAGNAAPEVRDMGVVSRTRVPSGPAPDAVATPELPVASAEPVAVATPASPPLEAPVAAVAGAADAAPAPDAPASTPTSAPTAAPVAEAAPAPSPAPPVLIGRNPMQGFRSGAMKGLAAPPPPSWAASPAPPAFSAVPPARDPRCGIVRDSRGTPLPGAQVTALGRTARMTRTGRDGRFCFDAAITGDTLVVLRIGFEPLRRVVALADSLVIELQPVGTLSPRGDPPGDR